MEDRFTLFGIVDVRVDLVLDRLAIDKIDLLGVSSSPIVTVIA